MKLDNLFEMSNIRKKESGLPMNIYVSSGGSVNSQHGPRIKVMTSTGDKFNPSSTVSIMLKKDITVDDVIGYHKLPSDMITALRQYINLNYDILMRYWNDEISTTEMVIGLKSI